MKQRMKLALVVYYLGACVIALAVGEESIETIMDEIRELKDGNVSPSTAKCFPNVTIGDKVFNHTILSKEFFPCPLNISSLLMQLFNGTASTKRDELTPPMASLCSAFVNLTSKVIFSKKSLIVCSQSILGSSSVDRNFCEHIQTVKQRSLNILEKLEELKFPLFSREFLTLVDMNKQVCEVICAEGSSRALCNAYYEMANFWTMNAPVTTGAKNRNGVLSTGEGDTGQGIEGTT